MLPAGQLREPPPTALLLTRAEALGVTFEQDCDLDPTVLALYADRHLMITANLPDLARADWPSWWRWFLAVGIAAASQEIPVFTLRWPMQDVGEVPQGKARALLAAGVEVAGGRHRNLHDLSVEEQARWLGVPLVIWQRWVRFHAADVHERRFGELARRRSQRPPRSDLPPANG